MSAVIRSQTDRGKSSPVGEPVLIRLRGVLAICGLSRSCLYEAVRDKRFPSQVKLHGRPSAWVKQEVHQWVAATIAAGRSYGQGHDTNPAKR